MDSPSLENQQQFGDRRLAQACGNAQDVVPCLMDRSGQVKAVSFFFRLLRQGSYFSKSTYKVIVLKELPLYSDTTPERWCASLHGNADPASTLMFRTFFETPDSSS
jgi:hypothetical protein